jgi:hypothetical protein
MPNFEVRESFNLHVLASLTEKDDIQIGQVRSEIFASLNAGDLQKLLCVLRSLFASIPYRLHVDREAYYHSIFYAVMTVLGFDMKAEVSVSYGSIDAVLELDDHVYVMEFKYRDCTVDDASLENKQKLFDKALTEGMDQINKKGYHKKYMESGKALYLAAFAFLGRDDIQMKATRIE